MKIEAVKWDSYKNLHRMKRGSRGEPQGHQMKEIISRKGACKWVWRWAGRKPGNSGVWGMKGRGRIRRQECSAGSNDANRAQWKQAGAVGTCVKIPPTLALKGKKKGVGNLCTLLFSLLSALHKSTGVKYKINLVQCFPKDNAENLHPRWNTHTIFGKVVHCVPTGESDKAISIVKAQKSPTVKKPI